MKKSLVFVLICLILSVSASALAAGTPKVSFAEASMSVNIDENYRLVLRLDRAFAADTDVTLAGSDGSRLTVPFVAGAVTASADVSPEGLTEKTVVTYTFAASEAYQTAKPQQCKVTLVPYPRVAFSQKEYLSFVGSKYAVKATLRNPNGILKKTTLELRGKDGILLASRAVAKGASAVSFSVDLTGETYGGHDMTVWMNGKQLEGTAYFAVGRLKDPILTGVDMPEGKKYLALSLDCAYGDFQTIQLLDLLDAHDVNLTWFVTGQWAKAYPDHVRDFIERGHEVGNHSIGHPHMVPLDLYRKFDQIRRTNDLIVEACGVKPKLFRPPFGEYDKYMKAICQADHMLLTMWSVSSKDSDNSYTYEAIYERLTTSLHSGDIILMHNDGQHTYEVLTNFIPYCKSLGYEFVTISELLALGEIRVKSN